MKRFLHSASRMLLSRNDQGLKIRSVKGSLGAYWLLVRTGFSSAVFFRFEQKPNATAMYL